MIPYKLSIIDYCLFQTPDCQLISYDFEDYDVFTDVIDCVLIYSDN